MKQLHVFAVFTTPEAFFDQQFRFLAEHGEDIILVSSYSPRAAEFAKRNQIRFLPVEIPRKLSPKSIVKAIIVLCKIIKKEKPDAVFGHTPVGALCAMVAAKCCCVKRRIYYRHGVIYTTMKGLKYHIFRLEEKFLSSLATSIINVSHSLSELAKKDRLNPSYKNIVIGHGTCGGIDAHNLFNPILIKKEIVLKKKKQLGLDNADIIYGFSGRFCVDKGLPELVEGFLRFLKKHPEVNSKLLLIGALDERDVLPMSTRDTISRHGDIIVTGWIDKVEMPYFYYMIDALIFPSHREGFGMCVIEASAMEKPILVSRSHGCIDSIEEHMTGEYVDLDADSICNGMELLLDDELRQFLGHNGRKKVLECYDYRVIWPLIIELYQKLLK